jgi:putative transposase
VPSGLYRFQQSGDLHFVTFSCYRRARLLTNPRARDIFEQTLEQVRKWYGVYIIGYVVMPEHVHLLISEPERSKLSVALQMLKQNVAQRVSPGVRFWQARYYDFNVWSAEKRVEKLKYLHRNPVNRGLVERPEDWKWSSYRHYVIGVDGVVEVESPMRAWRRRQTLLPLGTAPTLSAKAADKGGAPRFRT